MLARDIGTNDCWRLAPKPREDHASSIGRLSTVCRKGASKNLQSRAGTAGRERAHPFRQALFRGATIAQEISGSNMRCSLLVACGLTLLNCSTCFSVDAAQYCLRPFKESGTRSGNVVCCSTPAGWLGWKDDPHYWDKITGLDKLLLQGELTRSVLFRQPNCEHRGRCMSLRLLTWTGNPSAQGDPKGLLRYFLQEIEGSMDARPTDVKQLSPLNAVT